MRKFINQYGHYLILSFFVLAAATYFLTRSHSAIPTNYAFYVNEVTGEEVVLPVVSLPPLVGKDGQRTLVEAVKLSCEGGKHPYVAYYRKYDLTAQARIEEIVAGHDATRNDELQKYMVQGELVRRPAPGSPWVPAASAEGEKVREDAMCKSGQTTTPIFPR